MLGLFKKLSPNLRFLALIACLSTFASAKVPDAGQIIRFQPVLLRGQKAFISKGTASNGKFRAPLLLQWWEPGNYQLTISELPPRFFKSENKSSAITLIRQAKGCVIKTSEVLVSCKEPGFWASLELSGRSDLIAKELVEAKFFSSSDGVYSETDSRDAKPVAKNKRVFPAVGSNGAKPVAVLEVRGPELSKDPNGDDYPVIQFSPTFLSPLMARFKLGGDLYSIQATSDLETRHGHTRYSYVLANRLDVFSNKALIATFTRGEPIVSQKSVAPKELPRAITDQVALEESLTTEGQAFLKALVLTH